MRLSSLFSLACAIAALVLSLLCLFAGSSKSFLQDADLLTLNISRFGHTSLFNTSDGSGGLFSSLVNDLEGDLNNLVNNATSDIAQALNLPDFFNVHMMDYCEGSYTPNATAKHAHENITECSNRTVGFHFNVDKVISARLPDGITLQDLHWPDEIEDAEKTLRVASIVLTVFEIIGICFAALAAVTSILGVFFDGRLSGCLKLLVDLSAFFALAIASSISTAVILKAVHAVNKYGHDIGIAAYKGTRFLGMTWGATAVMLLASIFSIAQCCGGRKRDKRYGGKEAY